LAVIDSIICGLYENFEEVHDFVHKNFEEMHKIGQNNIEEMKKWYYT
jgi:hypothetical protein